MKLNELSHNPKRLISAFILLFSMLSIMLYAILSNHNLLFMEANYLIQKEEIYETLNMEDYVQISEAFFPKTKNCAGYRDSDENTIFLICDMYSPTVAKDGYKQFQEEIKERNGVIGEITTLQIDDLYYFVTQVDGLIFIEFTKDMNKSRLNTYIQSFKENRIPFLMNMARKTYGI